jgi:hypothetical protein
MSNPLAPTFRLFGRCGTNAEKSIDAIITIPAGITLDEEGFLEWLFKITNAPISALNKQDNAILEANKAALTGKLWCVSVGDCFAIGKGIVYCCYPFGWAVSTVEKVKAFFAQEDCFGSLPAPKDSDAVLVSRFNPDRKVA